MARKPRPAGEAGSSTQTEQVVDKRIFVVLVMAVYVINTKMQTLPTPFIGACVKAAPVILLSMLQPPSRDGNMIANGLLLSSIGDFVLDLDHIIPELFLVGLGAFAFAHMAYCIAFVDGAEMRQLLGPSVLAASGPGAMLYLLYPHVKANEPDLLVPVVIYSFIIYSMVVTSMSPRPSVSLRYRSLGILGALLFAISDSILAWDKFAYKVHNGKLWVMLTYYAAQLLIGSSSGSLDTSRRAVSTHTVHHSRESRQSREEEGGKGESGGAAAAEQSSDAGAAVPQSQETGKPKPQRRRMA